MRRRFIYFYLSTAIVFGIMSLNSCMSEPKVDVETEIEVPSGVENYFEKTMDFGFEGGQITMSFKTNLKWDMKIADSQNGVKWLTIDPAMGNAGNNKVKFITGENDAYEDRSVVVQFTSGDVKKTIRVNQKRLEAITLTADKFEVPTDGGNIDIEVNHSADYEVTIPDNYKSWIHKATNNTRGLLESSKLTFTIDPSDEYEKREGRIYFKSRDEEEVVTIYQAGSGKLVLSQNEYNLTSAEQEFSIDISSNFDFSMEMPEVDWLKENTSQTRGMSSHTLKFKVTENDDYSKKRSAKIKIFDKNNSKLSETVVVNQEAIGAVITIDTLEYSISSDKQDLDIDVKSNFDYNVDFQGSTWVKQRKNNSRGISSRLLKLTVDENSGIESRTAKIKLYDKNSSASVEVILNQLANTPTISAEKKEYEVDANKQNLDIKVSSNVDYIVDIFEGSDWITDRNATTRALATSTVKLAIAKNDSYDSRTAKIRLYEKDGTASDTITIIQKAKSGIEIPTKEFTVDENGGTLNIEVNANVDYKLTINDSWIKEAQKTRGLASHKHQLTIEALGDAEDRTGTITISNEDLKFKGTITIIQHQSFYFEDTDMIVLIGKEITPAITNHTGQNIEWSSSDTSVATVNKNGVVKGVSKGTATITAKTADGKHTITCKVTVCEITDLITVYSSGGVVSITNNLVQYGSKLNWTFQNGSAEKVTLKTLQLIDGETKTEGNEMTVNKEVSAETSVSYTTTIGIAGIHLPVTCRFKLEFDGKEYTKEAVYEK